MLADLERGLGIVLDGCEIEPTWRILTPEGDFLIPTRFDLGERTLSLIPRFMAWKLATGFVLTCETWLCPERARSSEEAVFAIGVTQEECLGVTQRIRRTSALSFGEPEWLPAESLDDAYFRLLPTGENEVTEMEAKTLAVVFGENGEMPARPLTR
jgi:hypothetical protein